MDYKKIHNKLIDYIRNTPHKKRIEVRNKFDYRLTSDVPIYIEIHHIIPRSTGGTDKVSNLIEVLPEEHIFLHMLRYKIYNDRNDILAVRMMLNGFDNKKSIKNIKTYLNKKIRSGYSFIRTHSSNIRQTCGWQSEDGRNRISKSRSGTFPAKDVETGKSIGSVSVNNPNVLSGRWVHITHGIKLSNDRKLRISQNNIGQSNPNASGLTDEDMIKIGKSLFDEFGTILSAEKILKISKIRNFKWITSYKSRFNGTGLTGFYKELEKITNTKYSQYESRKIKI